MEKVNVSDYEEPQHLMLAALNLAGLPVDYITVDLIHSTLAKLTEKKGQMDILDAVFIKENHARKWEAYFKKQEHEQGGE
jgi:predicted nucleotidyltransferase